MFKRCCQFGGQLLIGLTLLSLGVGPSPAAAMATLSETIEQAAADAHKTDEPSDSIPDDSTPTEDGGMTTSYVTPTSAKPHDVKDAVRPLAATAALLVQCVKPVQFRACSQTCCFNSMLVAFDHPPQLPNAPPLG